MQRLRITIPYVITSVILLSFCLVDPAGARSRYVSEDEWQKCFGHCVWVRRGTVELRCVRGCLRSFEASQMGGGGTFSYVWGCKFNLTERNWSCPRVLWPPRSISETAHATPGSTARRC